MATFCYYNSSGSDDSSGSEQQPQQLLLSTWEYLTPPELEYGSSNGTVIDCTCRPATILRSRRTEFALRKEEKNAKERGRVKRLNELYLSLRSILGGESRDCKLSKVPVLQGAIVYIKDLSKELDLLKARKPKIVRPPPLPPPPATLYYQSPESLVETTATHQHQIIHHHQYSCTCELTLSLNCTEVYDESLNSESNPSPTIINSVPHIPTNLVSPTPLQEMARFYFYSPPPMLSHSSAILNTPDVEFTELPSTHHPWAISPTHGLSNPPPPPLSHFNYQQ